MADWNGFGSLDLTDVTESGPPQLQVGKYHVRCTEAKISAPASNASARMVTAEFASVDGAGTIRMNFNVANPNDDAQRIGLGQLKSFLIASGHPNPNKPGDISSLVGLEVGVLVGMGKPYNNQKGKRVQYPEIKRFVEVSGLAAIAAPVANTDTDAALNGGSARTTADLDDEIPF